MREDLEQKPKVKVNDHWIQMLFPFEFDIKNPLTQGRQLHCLLKDSTLKQSLVNLPLPEPGQRLIENNQHEKIWIESEKETDRFSIKRGSFHPSIERILRGHTDTFCTLRLDKNKALQVLNSSKLSVKIKEGIKGNAGYSVTELLFSLSDIYLVMLDIGVGCITVNIQFSNIETGNELLAGIYALCRNDPDKEKYQIRWVDKNDDKSIKSLADIVENIAPIFKNGLARRSPGMWRKSFCFSAVKVDFESTGSELANEFGFRLARQYNDKYLPSSEIIARSVFQPFEQISHICSIEGGAVVVRAKEQSEYLDKFINDDAKSVYFPICLLAFIEYLSLITLANHECKNINFSSAKKSDFDHLASIRKTIYNFKLNYRFNNISQISMRNDIHYKWREVFKAMELLEELSGDTHEIESYIRNSLELDKQKSLKTVEILVFLGGGLMAISEFFDVKLYDQLIGGDAPSWAVNFALIFLSFVTGYLMISNRK